MEITTQSSGSSEATFHRPRQKEEALRGPGLCRKARGFRPDGLEFGPEAARESERAGKQEGKASPAPSADRED